MDRNAIRPAHHRRHPVHQNEHRARGEVAAVTPGRSDLQREEAAVSIQSERSAQTLATRLGVGDEALAALGDPFHRAPERLRREQDQHEFRIGDVARAETAADVRHDHPQRILGHAHHLRQHGAQLVRRLAAGAQRVAASGRVVIANRGTRLHERNDRPRIVDLQLDDMRRRVQTFRDGVPVSRLPLERTVARQLRPEQRRTRGQCSIDLGDRRHGPPVHRDQFGGIARRQRALGDDQSDRLADVAHTLDRQGILLSQRHLGAIGIEHFEGRSSGPRRKRTDAGGTKIFAGVNRQDARGVARGFGVDAGDLRVRMRRAHHHCVRLVRQVEVCGIPARTCQKALVLQARQRPADKGVHGSRPSITAGLRCTPRADFLTGPVARSLQVHRRCQTLSGAASWLMSMKGGRRPGCRPQALDLYLKHQVWWDRPARA